MNIDCQWISQNLEAFFCDRLTAEEDRLARTHIENCSNCRQEVRGFTAIDPLIKKFFRNQLAIAKAPNRRSPAVIFGGAAAIVVAALLLFAVVLRIPDSSPQTGSSGPSGSQPQMSAAPNPGNTPPTIKDDPAAPTIKESERAKPLPPVATGAAPALSPPLAADAPDFRVTDPAGYSKTLQDFRGHILVLGIWSSDQPEATANFERLYQTYSPNTKLRILGVSNERSKPANTTFPVAYNQGSRLLNAQAGDFLVVDAAGTIRYRGSLLQESNELAKTLQTTLEQLGIR